ncbi:hypothetical protein [Rhodovulum sp. FJ3]|uniref:hypothetical protein n=1 Tax=Rhodovulum sp. FJ3 TaxID=3079053 RepID=UPI00293DD6FC|nr:hypothetical protein [Rhodovulum sp. FJ3]MDV4168227.1 hypothetical protein [Rhodovulum sp. FJ3]
MSKIDSWMFFLLACSFMFGTAFMYPESVGDENAFLKGFVNHEFLNFMGVIVTITLASTANIHIELRKKEREAEEEFLDNTRRSVKQSAFSLIWALFLALVLVVVKPILPEAEVWQAIANTCSIAIILWGILVILDITKLAFRM